MKAESMHKPVANYEITFVDKDYVEIEFFTNIKEKQKKEENSDDPITFYEYDHFLVKVRNRSNLIEQLNNNYEAWLQYAIKHDNREHIPTEYELIKMQYDEYEPLDRPSVLKEMRDLDPALEEELLNLLIDSRQLMDQLRDNPSTVFKSGFRVPTVSEKLKLFKEKRKDI